MDSIMRWLVINILVFTTVMMMMSSQTNPQKMELDNLQEIGVASRPVSWARIPPVGSSPPHSYGHGLGGYRHGGHRGHYPPSKEARLEAQGDDHYASSGDKYSTGRGEVVAAPTQTGLHS